MRSWLGSAVVSAAVALACATGALGALHGCDGVGTHVDAGLEEARVGADAGTPHGELLHHGVSDGSARPRAPPRADRSREALVAAAPIVLALFVLLVSSRRR